MRRTTIHFFGKRLDLDDLAAAWKIARLRLLRSYLPPLPESTEEAELLASVSHSDHLGILSATFSHSWLLGKESRGHLGRPLTLGEIVEFLNHADVPCFMGAWKSESHSLVQYLYRGRCPQIPLLFCCDYWKEAARGLVTGLNEELDFSRHRSIGHGDHNCLDYVYVSSKIERRWGTVPAIIRNAILPLTHALKKKGVLLELKGYAEHVLFCRIDGVYDPLADVDRPILLEEIRKTIHHKFPDIEIRELISSTTDPNGWRQPHHSMKSPESSQDLSH